MPHPITIALYCLFLATFVLALQKLVHAIAHRYHLEFSVGLFSITGLRYSHHVPDPHDSASRRLKFCLSIGKFKIRFRRPTPDPTNNNDDDDPDRASCVRWVTVQVHDVSLVIPHLDIFLAPARKKHAHQHSELGRRLSAAAKGMRIPWWYSLSMVKWLIKTVYAVPAQFLISGLANYVDLQLVGLSVVLEEVAVVRLERVRIGLTLFADVELAGWKRIRRKSGGRVNEQQEQQQQSQYNRSDSKQDPSSATATQSSPPDETATKNAHHQPHSMTDPQHLFTDKFAEIGLVFDGLTVTDARSARIGQDVADGQVVAALALPSGTNVAISCHLNAACVTLKDIEIDVKIGEVAVGIDGALRMARAVERIRGEVGTRSAEGSRGRVEEHGTRNRQPASASRVSSSAVLSLLRSISLRIPKITVQYQFMEPSHSHMSLDSASSSSSTVALVFNSLETHIHLYEHEHPTSSSPAPASPSPSFPHRLDFSIATTHLDLTPALTKTDPLRLAQIDKISAATRVSAPVLPVPVSCSAHHVSGDYAELADETRLNDPNSRIVDIKIVVDRPRVVVDARRIEDLAGVVREMTRIRSAHEIAREDAQKHHLSWEDAMHPLRTPTPRFRNLPKLVGIVSILTPSLQFANTHTPSPTTISLGTADIVLELAGAYNALDDSTSFLSQPPTPTPAPIPRQHPPPITRRKSSTWAARLLRRHEEEPALAVWCERWMYNTTVGLKIREVVLEVRGKTGTEGKDGRYVAPEHRVVHFKQFVISVRGAAEVGLSKVEEGQDGAAEQQTVRQHQHQHPNHRHQPSITFGEPFFNSSPRLAEATAPRETIIDGESVRCDVAAAMEGLTLDLWAGKGEAANVLVMGGVKPLMSLVPEKSGRSTTKDPDATNAPLLALSALNSTFTIADLRLILPGTDRHNGAGTPAPEGYIDNAPRGTDITAGIIVELDRLSITYRGESAVAPRAGSPAVAVTPGGPEAYVPLPIVQETEEDPFLDLLMVRPLRTGCRRGGRIRVVVRRLRIQAFMVGAEGSMNVDGDVVLRVPEVSWKMEMLTEVEGQKKRVVWTTGVRIERVDAWYKVGHYYCAVLAAVGVMSLMELVAGKKGEARAAKDQKVAFDVSAVVEQLNFKATLPEKVNLFLRFDDMMVAHVIPTEPGSRDGEDDDDNNLVRIKRARFYGVANADESRWDELIGIDDFKLKLETDKILQETDVKQATSIILRVPALHFRVPFGYVYANVIDNAVNVFKITKHLNQRLIDGEPFNCEIPVRNDDPIRLPNINLDVNVLTLKIEDDPFEGRLSVIWKLGMTEQRRRLDREAAFQAKVNVLNGAEPSGDALKATVLGAPQGRSPAVVTSPFKPPPSPHANISVDTAQERLKEYNSRIWIKKVQASDAQRRRIFHQPNRHNRVPSEHYADEYSDPAFIISTVPPPLFPPLVKAVFCNIHLAVSGPSFPLEQVRPFMHDIGGGVPLDMPFSTLIPFRLNWKSGETWCQLRDYPLPLLYIPLMAPSAAAADGLPNVSTSPSWTLDGDFVFADELGDQEATRHVECLILEPSETVKVKYAMTVPRTASPPKFYSVVKADVHTPDPTRASWAISMQPAILEIALVFDTFTRPPVDPSPKVGFWDKIRLMIHTRSTINFVGNGDVSLVIKGTRDPYELKSRGAGLAKMWKRGVQIRIGHENPDGEFLQVESEQYVFGVPDLEAGGYVIKKIMPDHAGAPLRSTQGSSPASSSATTAVTEPKSYVSGAEQLQRQPPQLRLSQPTSNGDSKPKRSATVGSGSSSFSKDPAFLKVVLKLAGGIRFGLGCHFERQCKPGCQKCRGTEGKCRSLKFEPHYKVKYKNPEYVKVEEGKIYDAYEGFRSDFVHGSLSVVCPINSDVDSKSITPDSLPYNSMHLSPAFLSHFLQWWRLFGGEMSLPIKLGDLFPKEDLRVNQKLGKHLNTLKFKIKLDPLFLGYFNKEDGQEDGLIDGGGDSVGLKATVSQFSVDLHQHRELLVIEKKNLGPGLKPNWAMNEGEILLKNLDLRGVHVQYSTAGEENSNLALQRFMDDADSFQSGIFMFEPEAFMEGLDVNDPEWVDFDDYVELNTTTPDLKPKIQVLPIMYSPQMGYRKQLNRDDVEEYRYLAGTHACNMGRSKDTRGVQKYLLSERIRAVDEQIAIHHARLEYIRVKIDASSDDSLWNESNTVIEKTTTLFEKKHQLQGQLRSLNIADTHSNAPVTPTTASFENDTTSLWEDAFGHFSQRYIIHNPQIIYNNSVRNLIYRFLDLQLQERALDYYMSMAAVKFLRELTVSATKKTISSAPAMAEMEDAFDQKMAEELIQLLVSQEDSNLVAQNETEEAYKQEKENSNSSATSSYNDPIHQRENIPEGYSMMSESLVELLNPQISLQSETAPDSIVIVTAERIQLTSFKVLDNSFLGDATNELVKSRMIFSIDKAQFFVAAKDDFDSEELLLDNHYGARGRQYWLTWIPLEMLMDELGRTGKFQRVAERTAVSMQYDSYNPLRLKSNVNGAGKSSSSSMMSEADERSDSMHLNFPHLVFTANSAQYTAIHEVVSDLLLYKEPARKERLERLQEILLAADLDNLINALDDVVFLQDQMRQLRDLRDQYRENLAILNELQLQEFRAYKGQLLNVQEELYLMMEAITKAQSHKKEQRQDPKTNLKMVFSADKMVWTMMLDSSQPLCEWTLTKANFIWVSKEDHSSQNTLEVDQLQLVSKLASSRFSELISPYLESKKSVDFTRQKMLRGYLHNLPPVGGIAVVQHLEINLFPLKFRMTYDFGKQLVSYIFPEKRRAVTVSEDLNANTASVLVSESRDLQADSDQASRLSSTPTNGDGKIGSKHRSNSFVIKLNDNKGDLRPATSKSETVRQGDSQPQRDADQESTNSSSTQLSKKTLKKPVKQNSANVTTTKASDELALMKARASRNRTFIYIKIPGVPHCLSYQGPKEKNLEDLYDFVFRQPTLEYRNKTWSTLELLHQMKKDVLRAALAHSGALIKEKIMQRRYRQQTPLMHSPSTASLQSNSSSTSLDEMEATNLLTVGLTSQVGVDLASDPVPDGPTVEIFRPANDPISLDDEIEDSESDSDTDDDFDHDITEIIDEADDSSIHSNNSTSDQSHTAKDNVDGKRKRHLLGWRFGRQQKTEDLTTDKDSNESDSTSSSAQSGKKTVTRGRALSVGSQEHQAQPINQQQPLDDEFQQKSKLLLGRLYSPGVNSQMSLQSTSGHNFTDLTGKDPNGISNGDEKQ